MFFRALQNDYGQRIFNSANFGEFKNEELMNLIRNPDGTAKVVPIPKIIAVCPSTITVPGCDIYDIKIAGIFTNNNEDMSHWKVDNSRVIVLNTYENSCKVYLTADVRNNNLMNPQDENVDYYLNYKNLIPLPVQGLEPEVKKFKK